LAFKKSLAGKPRPAPINGFTPDERFFISFAQVYRNLTTPETLRRRLENDEHSPMEFRVIGPLSDFAPFHEIFGVKPGDRMWTPLDRRPAIW
jgi:putative endopeptidase